jgi:hypothetical protein
MSDANRVLEVEKEFIRVLNETVLEIVAEPPAPVRARADTSSVYQTKVAMVDELLKATDWQKQGSSEKHKIKISSKKMEVSSYSNY